MNATEFMKEFQALEASCGFFKLVDARGTRYWDVTRFYVYNYVYASILGAPYIYSQSLSASVVKRFAKRIICFFVGGLALLCAKLKGAEILFIKCSRARAEEGYRDLLIDPIIRLAQKPVFCIETYPAANRLFSAKYIFDYSSPFPIEHLKADIEYIETSLNARFGVNVCLSELISNALRVYYCELKFYERIMRFSKIGKVFVVQNGIQKGVFRAARNRVVEVSELQHGYIGYAHAAYSYPRIEYEPNSLHLPKCLLVYSESWLKGFYSPIPEKFEVGSSQHSFPGAKSKSSDRVLLISSAFHHRLLTKLLLALNNKLPNAKFIYKLHPNQFSNASVIKEEFCQLKNVEVVSDERSVMDCLRTDLHVICIQSTAAYEAIQSKSFVYVYRQLDYNLHDNMAGVAGFTFFNADSEFLGLYKQNCERSIDSWPEYFKPLNVDRVSEMLGSRTSRSYL